MIYQFARGEVLTTKKVVNEVFSCVKCNKIFETKAALNGHMLAHRTKEETVAVEAPQKSDKNDQEAHKCPECERTFAYAKALGSHRLRVHGVPGSSAGATRKRELSATETSEITCPECSLPMKSKIELGKHLQRKHGVPGKSTQKRLAKQNQLALHKPSERESHHEQIDRPSAKEFSSPAIDPIAFALAVGQVKEFCRSFAEEHDLPTRLFTRQFAELFLREARR